MKKWGIALLASILCIGLLAGCGSDKNDAASSAATDSAQPKSSASATTPAQKVTLKLWTGLTDEIMKPVIDAWNSKNPNIQVEHIPFTNDDPGNLKLNTALITGSDVDIFVNYYIQDYQKRIEQNNMVDLSTFTDYNIDEKMGPAAELWKVDGKYYGIPTIGDNRFVWLNKDMLDEAGLPVPYDWTWDDYREYAKKLTSGTRYGMLQYEFMLTESLMDNALSRDGYVKPDGTSGFDNPNVKTSLQLLHDMMFVDKSTIPIGEQISTKLDTATAFFKGEAAMENAGSWLFARATDLEKYPHDFVAAIAPEPRMPDDPTHRVSGGIGDTLSIYSKSKNKEAAWEFLKWYADEGIVLLAGKGRIGMSNAIAPDDILKLLLNGKDDLFDKESLKKVMLQNKLPFYKPVFDKQTDDIRKDEMQKYLLNAQSLDEAVANMVKRHNEYLKTIKK